MFGGMGDMMGMLGKVKDFQAKMKEAQESLGELSAAGESGGGMVKAEVNGHKKVLALEIDPDLLRPEDAEMVQDLVMAAVNNALEKIEDQIKEHLRQSTEGMLPNIPGFDLSKLMK
jgi:nucleoid-associated protein EbfC